MMDSQGSNESSSLLSVQNLLNGNTDALQSFESISPRDPVIIQQRLRLNDEEVLISVLLR